MPREEPVAGVRGGRDGGAVFGVAGDQRGAVRAEANEGLHTIRGGHDCCVLTGAGANLVVLVLELLVPDPVVAELVRAGAVVMVGAAGAGAGVAATDGVAGVAAGAAVAAAARRRAAAARRATARRRARAAAPRRCFARRLRRLRRAAAR